MLMLDFDLVFYSEDDSAGSTGEKVRRLPIS